MLAYIRQRVLTAIPVLLGVSLLVFLMLHLMPSDPVMILAAEHSAGSAPTSQVTQDMYDNMRRQLGLDRPLPVQFATFVWKALQFDFGRSFRNNRDVRDMILENLPYTLELAAAGVGVAIVVGLLLGTLAGVKQHSWLDHLTMGAAVFGVSVPIFWLGLMLLLLFSLQLGWLPSISYGSLAALVLPAITLGVREAAVIARLVRSSLVEVMLEDYVRTARAKGLANRIVVVRHALRNALIPVVTLVGLQLGGLLGGAVITETVFGRPGIGRLAVQAITQQDFPLVQGVVLFAATAYVVANLLVDVLYAWLDPRIRFAR